MSKVSRLVIPVFLAAMPLAFGGQFAETNVNMVSGQQFPNGDPFLRQQNEPSVAVSTRNAMHLVGGSNDYRSVDIAFSTPARPDDEETGDAWLGVYKSFDGGNRWISTLLDGYPQQNNLSSPLNGFQAAADPVVRAANNGLFYYAGIVLNRGNNPLSAVFMARFIDRNNVESGDPIAFLGTKIVDKGTAGQFIDKPWVAVAPMTNGGQCTVDGQTFAAQNVYLAYTILVGNDNNIRTKIMFTRSTDCGNTWASPQKLSETFSINQGVSIAVDPSNGNNVYVAWRRFAGGNDPNSIVIAKSTNAGGSFTKGMVVPNIGQPFDQGTTGAAIRTNAYPTMAVDNNGRVYIAFAQRNAMGDGQIFLTNSADGLTNWSAPAPVATPVGGTSLGRGHQLMPAMTFSAGKLTLAWYDLRDDSTVGKFTLNPDTTYTASRLLAGNLFIGQPQIVFWNYLSDTSPDVSISLLRRHTIDVYATESTSLGALPVFANATRVTRYRYGSVPPYNTIQDIEIDPPNLPMFHGGTVPFFGDYIDVASYVNAGASVGGTARIRHVVWTDNRDVRVPPGHPPDWTKYTPVQSSSLGATSIFDPTQAPPVCITNGFGQALYAGTRNQNIYTTRVTDGMFVGSPSNAKPLGSVPHAFTFFLQNTTNTTNLYHLSLSPQPLPNGNASFEQFKNTPTLDVNVPPHSTATRMVFVTAPAHTRVDVIVAQDGTSLTSIIPLNADPTNPDNPAIATNEIFNPEVANPEVANPEVANPEVANPEVANPEVANPEVANPEVANPEVANPEVANPEVANPEVANPEVANGDIANSSMTDTNWNASNEGTAAGGYTVKLFKLQDLPPGVSARLMLNKIYDTPLGRGCTLGVQHNRQIVASIKNPTFISDPNALSDASLTDPNATNATITLAPGETGRITLRLMNVTPGLPLDASSFVTPVVISQAVNTADANGENPKPPISLTILTTSLPDGMLGQTYNAPLSSIGGRSPITWSATGLPAGLTVSGASITGTPQASGTFSVTITATDSANPPHVRSRALPLQIADALVITTAALPDGTLAGQGVTVPDYDFTMTAIGGIGARTWSVTPALPTRLSLNPTTGRIGPNPVSQLVDQDYTFTVVDSSKPLPKSASKVLHLRTAPPLQITTQSVPHATVTQPYSTTIAATGGRPPYFWQIKGPNELSIDQNGTITGTFAQLNSSFVTVTVSDSGTPTRFASHQYDFSAVFPTINAVTPATAAAGFGQLVALDMTDLTSANGLTVRFSDGTTTDTGFLFSSPSSAKRLFVRLPFVGDNNGTATNLTPGALTIALLNGQTQLATGQMTLSGTPGAPTINFVMGLAIPPSEGNVCGSLASTNAITNISPGQGIAVSALGVDTTGATLIFRQTGRDPIQAAFSCAYSDPAFGIAPVFTVPPGLINGAVSVTLMTSANDISSAESAAVNMTVVPPTFACVGTPFELFNNWTGGAVLNGGTSPTFSTSGQTYCLDEIDDYHWNNATGKAPGTIGLTSVCELNCTVIGPFPAVGTPGQGDVPNANWSMKPPRQITINGNFTVNDSDAATWSYDPLVSRLGFSKVIVRDTVVTTPPPPTP